MTKFLSILPYCGEQAYPSFIAALRATNKGYVADMLAAYDPSSAPAGDATARELSSDVPGDQQNTDLSPPDETRVKQLDL